MGSIEQMIFPFWTFQKVEFYEAGLVFQVGVAGFPDLFKFKFLAFHNAKAVHGNIMSHNCFSVGMEVGKPTFLTLKNVSFKLYRIIWEKF